ANMQCFTCKCSVVGDKGVGKTSMIITSATSQFPSEYVPNTCDPKEITGKIGTEDFMLQLIDLPVPLEYDRLRPPAYPSYDGYLICFSVIDPASFENVETKWLREAPSYIYNSSTPFVLIGTKADLRTDPDVVEKLAKNGSAPVTFKQGTMLAKKTKALKYIECSALTHENLASLPTELVSALQEQYLKRTKKKRECQVL
uniref:Ras-related C3 botulinum toxin substrate 1 n=1 Tax=Macrostomum lignano TaxID=282301 RepID=A0A1I8G5Q0_9PLAT